MITSENTPQTINRLRAAAALVPVILAGLADSKISRERAAHMSAFVEWAASTTPGNEVEQKLVNEITNGLASLKTSLAG